MGYGVGAADLCAAGVGAPHIRQRLWWVGHAPANRREVRQRIHRKYAREGLGEGRQPGGRVADTKHPQRRQGDTAGNQHNRDNARRQEAAGGPATCGAVNPWANSVFIPCADGKWRRVPGRVVQPPSTGLQPGCEASEATRRGGAVEPAGCRSEKWEAEPALFPLADGIPNRVGTLRGAGNAIVPPLAAEFAAAYQEHKETCP